MDRQKTVDVYFSVFESDRYKGKNNLTKKGIYW